MEENNANTERKTPLSRGLTIKRGAKMLKSTFGLATVNHQVGDGTSLVSSLLFRDIF